MKFYLSIYFFWHSPTCCLKTNWRKFNLQFDILSRIFYRKNPWNVFARTIFKNDSRKLFVSFPFVHLRNSFSLSFCLSLPSNLLSYSHIELVVFLSFFLLYLFLSFEFIFLSSLNYIYYLTHKSLIHLFNLIFNFASLFWFLLWFISFTLWQVTVFLWW